MGPQETVRGAAAPEESPLPVNAIVHYYRAAMNRSNAWRNIVDNTTDWAVAATAGMLSFGIAGAGNRHMILFVAHFFILMFLLIESRRYSYYISIDWRVRLIEKEYFAAILEGGAAARATGWRQRLAGDLVQPHRPLSIWAAFSLRLRRTYIWMFLILTFAWISRVCTYPEPVLSLDQLWKQSGFAELHGWVFWFALAGLYAVLIRGLLNVPTTRKRLEEEGFSIG